MFGSGRLFAIGLWLIISSRGAPGGELLATDGDTTFLARFDGGVNAIHSAGIGRAVGNAVPVEGGWSGGGLFLDDGRFVSFPAAENFVAEQGTVEFWIRPRWDGKDPHRRLVFALSLGGKNYLNINKLPDGRFGAGMSGTRDGREFVYRRADRTIPEWKAGEWHHVAVCWGGGELILRLDGELAARETGAVAPRGHAGELRFLGSGYTLDEVCVSRIPRYRTGERISGPTIPDRTRSASWEFHEPAGVYRVPAWTPDDSAADPARAVARIVPRNPLDDTGAPNDFEESHESRTSGEPRIELFASPGEIEPAAFLVVAEKALEDVTVRISDLRSGVHAIAADRVDIRRVVRTRMRRLYTSPPGETEIVNRFLPRWRPLDIVRGEYREVWLSFRIPAAQGAGTYEGTITVQYAGGLREVPVRLEVLPIRLLEHPRKQLGIYYRMAATLLDPARGLEELHDLRGHGVRHLVTDLEVRYLRESNEIEVDCSELERGLERLRDAGFRDATIVVGSGLTDLARMLGHVEIRPPESGEVLDDDTEFHRIAKVAARELARLDARNPDVNIVATHLDEVFDKGRLPLYLRLSRALRQDPRVALYVTINTMKTRNDAMRRDIDPFVDVRGHHGYSFEWWLTRGHTVEEYEEELRESGDRAWFYHNARGVHFTAEWARIVNGVYLWSGPFAVHAPWVYQAFHANPFDDTDGPASRGHDFGMSFPGGAREGEPVPTRIWEAMREGGDDLRYVATLEAAITRARTSRPADAQAAQDVLDDLMELVRNPPDLPGGKPVVGTSAEAPRIDALARQFTGKDWQGKRREIAEWIVRLER